MQFWYKEIIGKPLELLPVGFLLISSFLYLCVLFKKHLVAVYSWEGYQFSHLLNGSNNFYLEEFLLRISGITYVCKAFNLLSGT